MKYQAGFTAVEVLVTLIIAFLLVGGSYQAYNVVLSHTEEANMRSTASNLAYDTLRKYAAKVEPSCVNRYYNNNDLIPSTIALPSTNRWMNTTYSCPFGLGNSLTMVTTTMNFESTEVKHAMLTTGQ